MKQKKLHTLSLQMIIKQITKRMISIEMVLLTVMEEQLYVEVSFPVCCNPEVGTMQGCKEIQCGF